ncbi:MAG: LytTR family DNA-binding domain-containing protein [Marinilabiliaceae bacterium]|jgi:DNA-binding LytR/AlgR family response regulator|nr:LytTR family DNA-binding domain-containing protein [Marinilabiliaceae bacterium]
MILKAIAIDDEVLALHKIERFCRQVDYIDLIGKFDNPVDAESFFRYNKVDLLFLDVQMNEYSGLELLNRLESKPHVILTTAFGHYSLKAFDLEIDDYLLKPIRFDRFKKATDKVYKIFKLEVSALNNTGATDDDSAYIYVTSGRKLERIALNDIQYIEGMRDYLRIITYKKKHMVLTVFSKMLDLLPEKEFCRVHRSYIVSLHKVEEVKNNSLVVYGNSIPLSKTYRKSFNEKFGIFRERKVNSKLMQ